MTMEEVKRNLNEGKYKTECRPKFQRYPQDHIFDETKSVIWNREEVARRNEEFRQEQESIRKEYAAKCVMFEEDVIAALQNDYGFSKPRAVLVFRKAYEQGHANGYHEVLDQADILAEFVENILTAN